MIRQVSDVGKVVTGKTPSSLTSGQFGKYLPFITPSDMDGRRRIEAPARWLSEAGAAALRSRIVEKAVAVSCIGWQMGKSVLIEKPSVTNQQLNSLVVFEDRADLLFVYYSMLAKREEIFRRGSGGSRTPILNKTDFERLELWVPPLQVQRAVAAVLGVLDDRIEVNERLNRSLEALAEDIFRSWFVDFDPVVAKHDGRRPVGVPANAIDLFPSHFQESEFGPIPTGWTAARVGDHFEVTMGQSPPGSTYNETGDGLPFYQGRTDFGFRYPSRRVYCTAPTRFADAGNTLVSVRAPVGDANMASERCAIGRGVAAVRHKGDNPSFTYYAMRALRDEFDVFESEGTLFGAIGGDDFRRIPFVHPPVPILKSFEALIGSMDAQIEANERESHTLIQLRDTLLNPLISGELNIKSAANAVSAAL